MKVYTLRKQQFLPISLEKAWHFFSNPKNLARITPPQMGFKILSISAPSDTTFAGQIIHYKINLPPGIPATWVTEITHVEQPIRFVDEQRKGPYRLWHHQHWFKEVPGGVEMHDEVNYALPMGILGRIAHQLFVERQLHAIFDYRFKVLDNEFPLLPVATS